MIQERSSDNDKRRLAEPLPDESIRTDLAQRIRFEGHSKHKMQPRAFGLEPFAGEDEDATYCDGHASFTPDDVQGARRLLQDGVEAGLIGANDKRGDPTLVWTVAESGWIFEARLTVPGQALYHAYPVLPSEAIARKVLAWFTHWAYERGNRPLLERLRLAQDRYR